MNSPLTVLLGLLCALAIPASMPAKSVAAQPKPLVFVFRAPSGVATLRARAADLSHRRQPLQVAVRAIYRYDPAADVWRRLEGPLPPRTVPVPEPRQNYSAGAEPILHTFPPVGLFWVIWDEDGHRYSSPAYAGPVLCNDVDVWPVPAGRVAICVPFPDRAQARSVPDPAGLPD